MWTDRSQTDLLKASCTSLDAKVDALKGAFEMSAALLKAAPPIDINQQEGSIRSGQISPRLSETDLEISEIADVRRTVTTLQHRFEQQQRNQRGMMSRLSTQVEQRFVALEQALNSGLETATLATTSMNDRLAKFVGLAEVLETAVQRVVASDKDMTALARKVERTEAGLYSRVQGVEGDIAGLASDLASFRLEISSIKAGGLSAANSSPSAASNTSGSMIETGEIDRLVSTLNEDRHRISLELQSSACSVQQLYSLLDTTSDQLRNLQQELQKGSEGDRADFRNEYSARLEALRKDISSECRRGASPGNRSGQLSTRKKVSAHKSLNNRSNSATRFNREGIGRIDEEGPQHAEAEEEVAQPLSQRSSQKSSPRDAMPKGWGSSGGQDRGAPAHPVQLVPRHLDSENIATEEGDQIGTSSASLFGSVGKSLGRLIA